MRVLASTFLAALFLAALLETGFAQTYPGEGPGPAMQNGGGKEITPQNFSEVKTRILTLIGERQKRLDQEKSCVEAATTADELKKCGPRRPPGGQRGQLEGGFGQQRPPQGNMGEGR